MLSVADMVNGIFYRLLLLGQTFLVRARVPYSKLFSSTSSFSSRAACFHFHCDFMMIIQFYLTLHIGVLVPRTTSTSSHGRAGRVRYIIPIMLSSASYLYVVYPHEWGCDSRRQRRMQLDGLLTHTTCGQVIPTRSALGKIRTNTTLFSSKK